MKKKKRKKFSNSPFIDITHLVNYTHLDIFEYSSFLTYQIKKKLNSEFLNVTNLLRKKCIIQINDNINPYILSNFINDNKIIPFWNNKVQLLSNKLFLPVNKNLKEINKPKTFCNSWFEVKNFVGIQNKYYNLSIKKNLNLKGKINKCRKIKLFLNPSQRKYMKQIIGTYRYFYNRCVSYFNNYDKKNKESYFYIDPKNEKSKIIIKLNEKNPYNFINMRPILKQNLPEWLLNNFPSHLIDQAFSEAFIKFNICLENCIKYGKLFEFKYKSAKENIQTINLEKQMISGLNNGFFVNWIIKNEYIFKNIRTSEKIQNFDFKGSSISYNKYLNKYFLNLNYTDKIKNNKRKKNICACDFGIRKFVTVYSPKEVMMIGKNSTNKLFKTCKEIDIIQSRIDKKRYYDKKKQKTFLVNSVRKRALKRALHRKIEYIKNLRNDLHNKTIAYLCSNFTAIIITPYEIQNMACNLSSKVARNMYNLGTYQFKIKLKNKAREKNIRIIEKPEPYTSKTCGNCGIITKVDGETYNCKKCKIVIDRDINGARNILLRNLKYV